MADEKKEAAKEPPKDAKKPEKSEDGAVSKPSFFKEHKAIIIISAVFGTLVLLMFGVLLMVLLKNPAGHTSDGAANSEQHDEDKDKDKDQEKDHADAASDEEHGANAKDHEKKSEIVTETGPALFMAIEPAFTVNVSGEGRLRVLQLKVQLMARNQTILDVASANLPIIQNAFVQLFSSKTYDELLTPEGKEALRQECLQIVRQIMIKELGQPGIENVLFTSMVMQ